MKSIKESITLSREFANRIQSAGGRAYYVGGCVRDFVMQRKVTDLDIEVYGIEYDSLCQILSAFGELKSYGKSFGVLSVAGYPIDFALPRREKPCGTGHRDFEISFCPDMEEKDAAYRRDFTINALMQDILTGEILDFFGGKEDIKGGIVRHISDEHFCEDPLRVLRGAQFAARLGFDTAPETLCLYQSISLKDISKERVMEEMKKALLLARRPSVFFETLKSADALSDWFAELSALAGIEQNPVYHAEGDVWNHTMLVLDEAALLRDKVQNPFGFMLSALCHDFGKKAATVEINGVLHAYGHEEAGLGIIEGFLKRLTNEKTLIKYVLNMCTLHMKPGVLARSKAKKKSTNKLFDSAIEPMDLIYLSEADRRGKIPKDESSTAFEFLTKRLDSYQELMAKPYVTGDDLIKNGIAPDERFKEILAHAHKLRLAGVDKETAFKECMGMFLKE